MTSRTFRNISLVLLFAAPILIPAFAFFLGALLGCRVDESNVHPCSVLGIDIGGVLAMTMLVPFLAPVFWIPGIVVWQVTKNS
jgi:hypothetical protein